VLFLSKGRGRPIIDANDEPVREGFSAMAQFRNMGLRKGSTVKLGYVIEDYLDKQRIKRTSNKIINFQETNSVRSD
jgi:hypothetical protein